MEKPETKTQTELSSRTAAVFSWIEFLGLSIFLISRWALGRTHWLAVAGVLLVASGFFYKTYHAWKAGHKKAFWLRIIFLIVALTLAFIIGYYAGQKQ